MPTYPISITTRAGKGTPLNAAEFDANLTNLRDATTDLNTRVTGVTGGTTLAGNADKVDGFHASQTPGASKVVVADPGGTTNAWVAAGTTALAGKVQLLTPTEAVAGTDTAKAVTSAAMRQAVLSWVRDNLGKFPGITPPSLNLFCGEATSDTAPVGTFTRSTTDTRLGQAGLIETVAADSVRREWDGSGNLLGWLIEGSRTNVVLYSRDLTNAAWVKTNCTAALSQTGIDGAASSASLLTATADTATCLQAITLASSTRFQTAYLKRVTGTGVVSMTMDGGSTWTNITSQLSSTAWTRVSIPSQTLSSLSVGFKLATNGDAIAIDGVQNETGTYPTSYIATTSTAVAHSADTWTVPLSASWFNTAAGTLYMAGYAALGVPESGTYQYLVHIDDGGYANRLLIRRDCNKYLAIYIQISNSTVARLSSVAKLTNGSAYRLAFSWSSSGFSVSLNSGACVTAPTTTTTTLPSGLTTCRIGSDVTGASQWGGHVLHTAYFPRAFTDAQLQALTEPVP